MFKKKSLTPKRKFFHQNRTISSKVKKLVLWKATIDPKRSSENWKLTSFFQPNKKGEGAEPGLTFPFQLHMNPPISNLLDNASFTYPASSGCIDFPFSKVPNPIFLPNLSQKIDSKSFQITIFRVEIQNQTRRPIYFAILSVLLFLTRVLFVSRLWMGVMWATYYLGFVIWTSSKLRAIGGT